MIDVAFIVSNLSSLSDDQLDWLEEEIVHWRKRKAELLSKLRPEVVEYEKGRVNKNELEIEEGNV